MDREELKEHCKRQVEQCELWAKSLGEEPSGKVYEEHKLILELLEQHLCKDAISRQVVKEQMIKYGFHAPDMTVTEFVEDLPPVNPQPKTGYCKDCKYFEYDSFAKVDGIPIIVAHEICSKWGNGCKTTEDGYCFLYEPQESEDKI